MEIIILDLNLVLIIYWKILAFEMVFEMITVSVNLNVNVTNANLPTDDAHLASYSKSSEYLHCD